MNCIIICQSNKGLWANILWANIYKKSFEEQIFEYHYRETQRAVPKVKTKGAGCFESNFVDFFGSEKEKMSTA